MKSLTSQGYARVWDTVERETVLAHVAIVEKILGKRLPKGAQVHHWNEKKTDNRPANLVVCPSAAYHNLLHKRTRAYDACGHADWLKCHICKQHDDPIRLVIRPYKTTTRHYHHQCNVDYLAAHRAQKRIALESAGLAKISTRKRGGDGRFVSESPAAQGHADRVTE